MNSAERYNELAKKLGLPADAVTGTDASHQIMNMFEELVRRIINLEEKVKC